MTDCQLESIAEKGTYPTLAYLAAYLEHEKDINGEIEYVEAVSRGLASLDETPYADWEKIYTKLSKYDYEFEIDSSFKVSVNGVEAGIPSGYMKIPTETLDITENGEHDVTDYAKVNVNISTSNIETDENISVSFQCTDTSITAEVQNAGNNIISYDFILKKKSNDNYVSKASTTNTVQITNLELDTSYIGYIIVCDKEGNIKKTNEEEIKTLDGPTIQIISVNSLDCCNTVNANKATVEQVLFDGNTNNGGGYKGVLFGGGGADYMEIQVLKRTTIFAYGHNYSDGGGSSGKNLKIKKYNGSSYVDLTTVATKTDGTRYELVTLDSGNYRVYPASNYVSFDEWELVTVQ